MGLHIISRTIVMATWAVTPLALAQPVDVARVQSRIFDIDYSVNTEALPLTSAVLWYTLDRGQTWHQYGQDDDRQPPFAFNAAGEGLHGFFLQVVNEAGPSSQPPTSATRPHQWAFVDFTPPVVQLREPVQTTVLGAPVLQIRWTAVDAHLQPRPVEIAYRAPGSDVWQPVTAEPLANTGRYDWPLPEGMTGPLTFRVTVRDEGGHAITSAPIMVEIGPPTAPALPSATSPAGVTPAKLAAIGVEPAPAGTGSAENRERALRLFREGLAQRDRGEYREGVARLRQAAALDPESTETFVELGRMYYLLGRLEEAGAAFDVALGQQPRLRSALRGSAMVDRKKNDFASATEKLRTILRHNPNDAEVWLNLGDVAVFKGDETLARECYQRAATVDPAATETVETARKWLDLMETSKRQNVETSKQERQQATGNRQ